MPHSAQRQTYEYLKHYGAKILIPLVDESWLKQVIIWVGTITGFLLGHDNINILWILLLLIMIDWVTGILAAIKNEVPVQSRRLASTAYKFIVYFSLIVTAKLCGDALGFDKIEKLVIVFYVAVEAYSIVENAEKLGVPIPELFRKAIKGKIDEQSPMKS